MASNDWLSNNFPTLVRLVGLFKGNKGQRRHPRRRSQRGAPAAQQEAPSTDATLESTAPDLQQAVTEPISDVEELIEAAELSAVEEAVELPEIVDGPIAIDDSPIVEETVASTPVASKPADTPTIASAHVAGDEPLVQPEPTPAESKKPPVQVSAAPEIESTSVPLLPDLALDLEPNVAAARDQMQSFIADRSNADEFRREAQEMLEQAEMEWEEAGRLLDVARRACERGVTLNLPGFATRLRLIKEIQERRKTQAQIRKNTSDNAWEEADHARHRATAEWDKARAEMETAALQAKRELTEAQHLPTIAESLIGSALEDVNRARAINEDMARLGRESFSLLGATNISDEGGPGSLLMPESTTDELGSQRVSPDLVSDEAQESGEVDVAPSMTTNEPQVLSEESQAAKTVEPVESPPMPVAEVVEFSAIPEPEIIEATPMPVAEVIESPPIPEPDIVESPVMSAAEALRQEMAAAAFTTAPPDMGTLPPEGEVDVPATDVPTGPVSLVEELQRGLEASRNLSVSTGTPEAVAEPPAPPDATSAEADEDRLQTVAQDLTFQPDVVDSVTTPAETTQRETSGPLAESYSGLLFLMFPASLDQNQLETVWEVLDDIAGSGAIVDNRLVSQAEGIQFTLELRDKVLTMDVLRNRMPGAGLVAIAEDRVKVDWPR